MNNSDHKILLVDDEPDILEFLSYNLKKEGYQVYTAGTGDEGVAVAKKEMPHLVLLDVMMPGVDGIEVCRELRSAQGMDGVVIAFLTARSEDYSHIAGFEAGADDYINKPIKPRVLLSRIKALLRRSGSGNESQAMDVGKLRIDRESYLVFKEGEEISLPRKEFELLSLLASKPGKVFARDEILNKVWGDEVVVGDRTIDVHIRKLREKLGEEFIRTVKGVGYKFEF
jgi:two-component system, OmpR family, alkaline phosphatase synthesis response regulator PhoP